MTVATLNWKEQFEWMTRLRPGSRVQLDGVSWSEYEDALASLENPAGLRLSFDRGKLEIMTLSPRHEILTSLFVPLIVVLTQALNLDFASLRSTTFRKEEESRGTEPDDCFYIRNFEKIAGKDEIDLSVDPPPDLIIEVDVSHPTLEKLPIYCSLGVDEVWRHDGERIIFYVRGGAGYEVVARSRLFPLLASSDLLPFLEEGKARGINAMMKAFRTWLESRLPRG